MRTTYKEPVSVTRRLPGIRRFLLIVLAGTWLILLSRASGVPIAAQGAPPAGEIAGAIRAPQGYRPEDRAPLPALPRAAALSPSTGLKAVAIVGDVGGSTADYRADMDAAVKVLEDRGAAVSRFYYGQGSFNWAQIVAAAQGAHMMLYMGHGVYWSTQEPVVVGGFYLGDNQFISPAQIRSDLNGVLAEDSLIIFSHACFTAGSAAGDSSISQAEAARRVAMYADPFVDIGMRAYFANNYFGSAAATLNAILDGETMGVVFTSYAWFNPSDFVDLSYPEPGYDLWLDGHAPSSWSQAFVGIPGYAFGLTAPALCELPDALSFVFSIAEQRLVPASYTLRPANVGNETAMQWAATSEGSWFSALPSSGSTPGSFQVTPTTFDAHAAATYSGVLTVTVTSPVGVSGSPHRVDVQLLVIDEPIHDLYLPAAFETWKR